MITFEQIKIYKKKNEKKKLVNIALKWYLKFG